VGALAVRRAPVDLGGLLRLTADIFGARLAERGLALELRLEGAAGEGAAACGLPDLRPATAAPRPGGDGAGDAGARPDGSGGAADGGPDDAASPLLTLADARRMQQLFNNLLENSVRYTDPGGRLRIAAWRAPASDADADATGAGGGAADEIAIEFCDSAPGVPAAHLPRLFDRFHRVDTSRSRESGGAGLGLAIVRGIVEAHGGRIAAVPSPLGGLCIRLHLPAADPQEDAA
jgi:two-component system sensor histidine kinase BaeS